MRLAGYLAVKCFTLLSNKQRNRLAHAANGNTAAYLGGNTYPAVHAVRCAPLALLRGTGGREGNSAFRFQTYQLQVAAWLSPVSRLSRALLQVSLAAEHAVIDFSDDEAGKTGTYYMAALERFDS